MNYFDWVNRHLGRAADYDGVYGAQCVDLTKYQLKEIHGIRPGSWGNARAYYEEFNNKSWAGYKEMNAAFERIPNTPDFVPMTGDIGVFVPTDSSDKKTAGHIVTCTGEGTTKHFYSYDQNWTGNRDACARIKHKYVKEGSRGQLRFIGVLRAKNRSEYSKVVARDVNIRKGPGTLYSVIGEAKAGEKLIIDYIDGKWYYAHGLGWVNGNYLKTA